VLDEMMTRLMGVNDEAAIHYEFTKIAQNFNFKSNTYVDMGYRNDESSAPYFLTSLEDSFVNDYSGENYFQHDAILRRSCNVTVPFSWYDCPEYQHARSYHRGRKNYSRKILELAYDYQFSDGVIIPVHSHDASGGRRSSFISLYYEKEGRRAEYSKPLPIELRLMCSILHERLQVIRGVDSKPSRTVVLSDREQECLLWAARGKTRSETADILVISESAVIYYIKSAMKKLNVYNKTHAVAIAVRDGLIIP
jgi:DNA-binding CsgD family transcriptional regulator